MNVQKIQSIYLQAGEAFSNKTKSFPQKAVARNSDPIPQPDALPHISQAALNLHRIDQTMSDLEKMVSKMISQLLEMRRTLPPFKPEDAERVRILRGYIGLRHLIDKLTIPPPAKTEWIKEGINLPELSEKSTDQEVDRVFTELEKAVKFFRDKRSYLGALSGM